MYSYICILMCYVFLRLLHFAELKLTLCYKTANSFSSSFFTNLNKTQNVCVCVVYSCNNVVSE